MTRPPATPYLTGLASADHNLGPGGDMRMRATAAVLHTLFNYDALLGSSGNRVFGCSCLPKAVTGVSQPGVGLESAYSGPRVELRPPGHPPPVLRADLALVGAVHLGGGGNQRRHGYRVGDCSADGGTRLGCVRGALGSICFITRLALFPLLHAVP
jgi:hypothetical protein